MSRDDASASQSHTLEDRAFRTDPDVVFDHHIGRGHAVVVHRPLSLELIERVFAAGRCVKRMRVAVEDVHSRSDEHEVADCHRPLHPQP